MPGTTELIIIAVIALLIFGRRLPDVARSVGKSIVEFKKGIRDVKSEVDVQSSSEQPPKIEHKPEAEAPAASEPPADAASKQEQASTPSES
jgi:sec-independent protein translocase protein TatA